MKYFIVLIIVGLISVVAIPPAFSQEQDVPAIGKWEIPVTNTSGVTWRDSTVCIVRTDLGIGYIHTFHPDTHSPEWEPSYITIDGTDRNTGDITWDGTYFWVEDRNTSTPKILKVNSSGEVVDEIPQPGSEMNGLVYDSTRKSLWNLDNSVVAPTVYELNTNFVIHNLQFGSWSGTSMPRSSGYFTGDQDKTYTFTMNQNGSVGITDPLTVHWDDGGVLSGDENIGAGYTPDTWINVAEGVQIQFSTGDVVSGNYFTVAVYVSGDVRSEVELATITNASGLGFDGLYLWTIDLSGNPTNCHNINPLTGETGRKVFQTYWDFDLSCAVDDDRYIWALKPDDTDPDSLFRLEAFIARPVDTVLLYAAEDYSCVSDFETDLDYYFNDVSYVNAGTTIPSVAELSKKDVILTWSYNNYSDGTNAGNRLQDCLELGGGVVIGARAWDSEDLGCQLQGGITTSTDPVYNPFTPLDEEHCHYTSNILSNQGIRRGSLLFAQTVWSDDGSATKYGYNLHAVRAYWKNHVELKDWVEDDPDNPWLSLWEDSSWEINSCQINLEQNVRGCSYAFYGFRDFMFYCDPAVPRIRVINLRNSNRVTLQPAGFTINNPRGLAWRLPSKYLYFADGDGSGGSIIYILEIKPGPPITLQVYTSRAYPGVEYRDLAYSKYYGPYLWALNATTNRIDQLNHFTLQTTGVSYDTYFDPGEDPWGLAYTKITKEDESFRLFVSGMWSSSSWGGGNPPHYAKGKIVELDAETGDIISEIPASVYYPTGLASSGDNVWSMGQFTWDSVSDWRVCKSDIDLWDDEPPAPLSGDGPPQILGGNPPRWTQYMSAKNFVGNYMTGSPTNVIAINHCPGIHPAEDPPIDHEVFVPSLIWANAIKIVFRCLPNFHVNFYNTPGRYKQIHPPGPDDFIQWRCRIWNTAYSESQPPYDNNSVDIWMTYDGPGSTDGLLQIWDGTQLTDHVHIGSFPYRRLIRGTISYIVPPVLNGDYRISMYAGNWGGSHDGSESYMYDFFDVYIVSDEPLGAMGDSSRRKLCYGNEDANPLEHPIVFIDWDDDLDQQE